MGCDELKTLEIENEEQNPTNDKFSRKTNLWVKMYTIYLQTDNNFVDSCIKSQEELEDKLHSYISTKIKKNDSDVPYFNTKDDIWTKYANINFNEYYLLAINGVNRVLRVEEDNGNYLIFHDIQPGDINKYNALVFSKEGVGPEPEIFYQSPKKI